MPPRKRSLRAVGGDEKRTTPSTVAEAVESGTLRDQYVAMRARIARAIDAPDIRGADLAALSRRLHELGKEIAALDLQVIEEGADIASASDVAWTAI